MNIHSKKITFPDAKLIRKENDIFRTDFLSPLSCTLPESGLINYLEISDLCTCFSRIYDSTVWFAFFSCLNFICLHLQQKYDYSHPPSRHVPLVCPQILIINIDFLFVVSLHCQKHQCLHCIKIHLIQTLLIQITKIDNQLK